MLTGLVSVWEGFVRTSVSSPDRLAVITSTESLTYAGLAAEALKARMGLRRAGLGTGTRVGVCCQRSTRTIALLLGCLGAGAVCVPLDPGDPTDWVVETAAAAAVDALVVDRMAPWLNFLDRRVRVLESGELLITGDTAAGETDPIGRDDPAMLVCTSGSTGDPKAVLLTNGNLLSYHAALLHAVGVNADDRYLHAASVSFSSANRQLLLPLLTGAAVVLSSPEQRADIEQLIALIEDCRVTVLDLVPTQLEMVAEAINRGTGRSHFDELRNSVRLTLTASEALTGGIVEKWRSIMGVTHPIINEAYS